MKKSAAMNAKLISVVFAAMLALSLAACSYNTTDVVDSDYYNNADNEGHIMFAFYNFFPIDVTIKKGERIGQGVFKKFLKADGDNAAAIRTGGFGSTK